MLRFLWLMAGNRSPANQCREQGQNDRRGAIAHVRTHTTSHAPSAVPCRPLSSMSRRSQ